MIAGLGAIATPEPAPSLSGSGFRIVDRMDETAEASPMPRLSVEMLPDDPALRAWCERYAQDHGARIETDLSIVQRAMPKGRLLDVGATPPFLMSILSGAGREVLGVDVDPSRFGSAIESRGLDVRRCDIEREPLPFEDGSFTMSELARVLSAGGRLMVTTPNMRSARGIVSLVARGRSAFLCPDVFAEYEKLRTIGHMGHVREYTARDVTDLCARVGLSRVSTIYRRSARSSASERLLCTIVPTMRPYVTIIFERGGSMERAMSRRPHTERSNR